LGWEANGVVRVIITISRYTGAVLNFWESTRTIHFQGPGSPAKEFEQAFYDAISPEEAHGSNCLARRVAKLEEENIRLEQRISKIEVPSIKKLA